MSYRASVAGRLIAAATLVAWIALLPSESLAQTGPFGGLAGAWSGNGKILVKDGGNENIRCRATYTISSTGSGLGQVLSCASDSYRFDLTTNVTAAGSTLSGNWSETSRKMNGTLTGKINGDKIDALVEANGYSGSLTVHTSGNRQTIALRSQSTDLRGVDITLTR
jgi:hypothetical protein